MYIRIIAIWIVLTGLIILTSCRSPENPSPRIIDGVINLTEWDFKKNGILNLAGNIRYQKLNARNMALLKNTEHFDSRPIAENQKAFPGNQKKGSYYFTVRIELKNSQERLGLYLQYSNSAYEIFANGMLIFKNSFSGLSTGEITSQHRPSYTQLPLPQDGNIMLCIKIENLTDRSSNPFFPILKIGTNKDIQNYAQRLFFFNSIVLSALLITGIYYLYFWILRKPDKRFLFFSICAFCVAIRIFAQNRLLTIFIPDKNLFNLQYQIEYISSMYAGLFFMRYLDEVLGIKTKQNSKILNLLFIAFLITFLILSFLLFIPYINFFSNANTLANILVSIMGIFFVSKIVQTPKRKKKDIAILLVASSILMTCILIDTSIIEFEKVRNMLGSPDLYFSQLGFILFIVIQAFRLSTDVATTYTANDHLRNNLKIEIEKKTNQLDRANEELKQLNQILIEKDKEKTHFYQNTTHELRTHLNLVLGPIERLTSGICGHLSEAQAAQLAMSSRNTKKLLQLINLLLEHAKIESGLIRLDVQKIPIIKLIRRCIAGFESLFAQKRLTLMLKTNIEETLVKLDEEKIEWIITNLISNAIKFTEAGDITITCRVEVNIDQEEKVSPSTEGWLELLIRDTGCGIQPEKLSRIFDPFFQADTSHSRSYAGSGIGLGIVKEYVNLHNGKITVNSVLKKGTEFIIRLPVQFAAPPIVYQDLFTLLTIEPQQVVSSILPATSRPDNGGYNNPTILIVEDYADMRLYLREILQKEYTIYEAENGNIALEQLNHILPDVIISDLMMPEMDGYQLVNQLRKTPQHALVPIIIITAGEFPSDGHFFQQVDEVLSKPIIPGELKIRIRNVLALHRKQVLIAGKNPDSKITLQTEAESNDEIRSLPFPILVVDEDTSIINDYKTTLSYLGYTDILLCTDSRQVLSTIKTQPVSLVLLDLSMPYQSGQKVLTKIKEEYPLIEVVIISAINNIQTAIECIKQGAYDYFIKPVEIHKLQNAIEHISKTFRLQEDLIKLQHERKSGRLKNPEAFSHIITKHPSMLKLFEYIEDISDSSAPVLIRGENGTGKDTLPGVLHALSQRRTRNLITVNVAGLDDTMFTDTLFGHTKGAFTGAEKSREGLVEQARGGTLFLDELGDLSDISQKKLLRLLENGEYYPLGSEKMRTTDTRIVAATNVNLDEKISKGEFRSDLYYRFRFKLTLPPLRERKGDLPLLVEYFMQQLAEKYNKRKPTIPNELYQWLETYDFPGNIRELMSMIEAALLNHKQKVLSIRYFKDYIMQRTENINIAKHGNFEEFIKKTEILPHIKQMELLLIKEAMSRTKGAQNIAAELIGMTSSTISRRLNK